MLRLSHGISPSTQGRVLMPSPETYPPRDSFREQQPPVDPHPVDGNDTVDSRHLPCQSCIQFQKIAIRPKHQPLPPHLRLDQWPEVLRPISPVLTRVFSTLCVIAYGQRNMEAVWDLAVEDGQLWVESTDRIARRVEATGVTVRSSSPSNPRKHALISSGKNGLLLAVSAALVTTTPPLGPMMNYTLRASYILQLTSFGLTLGSIVVGSALLYTIPMCTGEWYREVGSSHISTLSVIPTLHSMF